MRYLELTEVPIDDFQVVGPEPTSTRDGSGDISANEYKGITSDKAVQKIRNAFEKTPHIFNFYFYTEERAMSKLKKIHKIDDLKSVAPDLYDVVKVEPNAISVIYTTNFTSKPRYIPFTAWILVHRIQHIMQMGGADKSLVGIWDEIDMHLGESLINIANLAYATDYKRKYRPPFLNDPVPNGLVNAIFTMRSARKKMLTTALDWSGELFAQYIFSGKIKFNNLPKTLIVKGLGSEDKPIKERNEALANARLQELAGRLPAMFDELLNKMHGHLIVL